MTGASWQLCLQLQLVFWEIVFNLSSSPARIFMGDVVTHIQRRTKNNTSSVRFWRWHITRKIICFWTVSVDSNFACRAQLSGSHYLVFWRGQTLSEKHSVLVKPITFQIWTGLWGSRTFRLPEFLDKRHMKVVGFWALHTGRSYPLDDISSTHFC